MSFHSRGIHLWGTPLMPVSVVAWKLVGIKAWLPIRTTESIRTPKRVWYELAALLAQTYPQRNQRGVGGPLLYEWEIDRASLGSVGSQKQNQCTPKNNKWDNTFSVYYVTLREFYFCFPQQFKPRTKALKASASWKAYPIWDSTNLPYRWMNSLALEGYLCLGAVGPCGVYFHFFLSKRSLFCETCSMAPSSSLISLILWQPISSLSLLPFFLSIFPSLSLSFFFPFFPKEALFSVWAFCSVPHTAI